MIIYTLLLLSTHIYDSHSLECSNRRAGSCYCSSSSSDQVLSTSVFCPDANTPKISLVLQENQYLTIKCIRRVTRDEVVTYLTELKIGNSSFVKMTGCPVPQNQQSFADIFEQAGVRGIRALSVSRAYHGKQQTGLQGSHFYGFSSLYHLDLANNGIKYINKDFFRDFQNLKVLDLSSNDGIEFADASLDNLTVLEELKLGSCGIKKLSENFFDKLTNLKILSLHGNEIAELPPNVFKNQKSVTNLVLTRNLLVGFPEGIFDNMISLTKIDLGYNRFETFPEKMFYQNHHLQAISIIVNGACPSIHPQCKDAITKLKLPANLFSNSSVEEIKILATPIAEIPPNFLAGCSQLKKITVKESMIQNLPESLFKNTKDLEQIDLSGNLIKVLPDNIFKGLQNLEKLKITSNNLQSISDKTIKGLQNLKQLILRQNSIKRIDRSALSENWSLEEIDLSSNLLKDEDTQCLKNNVLEKLETLNLAKNHISLIHQDIFLLSDLKSLNLSHNHIGDIRDVRDIDFKQKQGLMVDLSFNKIERVILRNQFNISGHNFHLNLEGNPLICDCHITELKQKLEGTLGMDNLYYNMFTLTSNNLKCGSNSPVNNPGKYLQNVKFENLLCPFPSASMPYVQCTKQCSCFLDRFYKETVMNCSNQNMTQFPESLVLVERESNAIRLHMENNLLTNISKDIKLPFFQNISHLYLSNNRIVHFEKKMIPQKLKKLYLDQNKISQIEEKDLESLDMQVKQTGLVLRLSKNPFLCTCVNKDLYHFVQNRENVIQDAMDISLECEQGDLKLLDCELHNFCDTSMSPLLIAGVIIIVIILMSVCIVLVFYSCHRETIQIWIYSKPWARIFFTEDLIDKDKPYDAFLSYSHMDADFVEKILLQGLENPENEDHKYKCLIHTRDWNIGQMIPDQIIQSVESSRRTIIILSKAYIESMWTKLEFRAAHTQAIQDKTKRVILITVGPLPTDKNLDTDLQKYISLNTYLDTEDPWFWQKLRYAMPHRGTMWKKKKSRRVTDKIELIRSMASVEMSKESGTPSPKTGNGRHILSEHVAAKINKDLLMKESGAVARNNPHLHPNTDNIIKDRTHIDDSYLLV